MLTPLSPDVYPNIDTPIIANINPIQAFLFIFSFNIKYASTAPTAGYNEDIIAV